MPQTVPVPKFISANAERGLKYAAEGKAGEGMTDKTKREARDMVEGSISEDKVRRMGPWFARHRVDMEAPANDPKNDAFPGKGAVAWLVWGGSTSGDIMDAAKWAERTVERLDREREKAASLDRLPKGEATSMDTIEARLDLALADIAAKDGQVAEARAVAEKAAAENIELSGKVAELTAALDAMKAEKAAVDAAVAQAVESAVTASAEAAKIAASVGVAPVESAPETAAKGDIVSQYFALEGDARTKFFAEHKVSILSALRK